MGRTGKPMSSTIDIPLTFLLTVCLPPQCGEIIQIADISQWLRHITHLVERRHELRTYSQDTIELHRQRYEDNFYKWEHFMYQGNAYEYYVLPQEECPKGLPDFVQCWTPDPAILRAEDAPGNLVLLGISEIVPEAFRPFALIHELEKFVHIGIETAGHGVLSVEQELTLVREQLSPEDQSVYIQWRIDYFKRLIVHLQAMSEDASQEYRKALDLLHLALAA